LCEFALCLCESENRDIINSSDESADIWRQVERADERSCSLEPASDIGNVNALRGGVCA
jgi:hypothetical protein